MRFLGRGCRPSGRRECYFKRASEILYCVIMASRKRSRARAPKKRIRKAPSAPSRSRKEHDFEQGIDQFGEEMGRLGERLGKRFEKRADEWERRGKGCDSWSLKTFGLAGPVLSSVLAMILFVILTWFLGMVSAGAGTGIIYNIWAFLSAYSGWFFLIFLFSAYKSYFSKVHKEAYRPLSPVFSGIGLTIAAWLIARMISIANMSVGSPFLYWASALLENNLLLLFWIFVVAGYLVLAACKASGCGYAIKEPGIEARHEVRAHHYAAAPVRSALRYRRLYRSGESKILGGVCGGLGEYFGIDPVIIRLVWVVLSMFWGFGIVLYIIMWIIVPRNPKHRWD